jgi:excisionase family DNA binding protein
VEAAKNPSGGGNMGEIGFGAMGMAAMQSMQQQQQQQPPAAVSMPAESSGTPDVMTPSQAASILQVSEEDVVAAIEAGDLKARKIGNAYRISKTSLDEFLAG